MIGSRKNAALIALYYYEGGFDLHEMGWKYLGSGCSRNAWLAPDGIVYKYGDTWENNSEVRNVRRLRRENMRAQLAALNVYIPNVTRYNLSNPREVIIAMEYITGTHTFLCSAAMGRWTKDSRPNYGSKWVYDRKCDCNFKVCPRDVTLAMEKFRISDMHEGNVIVDANQRFCVVDVAG